jgi:hypothetical protein
VLERSEVELDLDDHERYTADTAIVVTEPTFTGSERLALPRYLAGYSGLTREACLLDLRQFVAWCEGHSVRLFSVRRADI